MRSIACVLVAVFALALVRPAKATDLRPVQYIALYGQLRALMAAQFAIEIANDNRLATSEYTIAVTIRNKINGTLVYQSEIPGQNIAPYTHLTLLLTQLWYPLTSGMYTITTSISFGEDIDPSNNTITQDAFVYPPALLAALYWNAYVRPFVNRDRSDATFQYRYGPSNVYRYLNVRAWTLAGIAYWLLRNQAVPPSQDSVTMQQNVDLHTVLTPSTTDSLKFSYDLTDTTLSTDTTLKAYQWLHLDSTRIDQGGVRDTTRTSVRLSPITVPNGSVVTDGLVWGCRVPNLDLDSANHPYNEAADFAGDINACGPTSAANSMEWLEQEFPMKKTGLTHRQKLEELGRMMRREKEEGVWSEDFIRGKLEFINKYDLPIKVKFQIRGSTSDAESDDDYIKTAKNEGDGGYPKWEWLKKEVKDSEDVEMFVEFHEDSGSGSTVTGRHAVVITGASQSATSKDLWYKDDGTQERAGGTRERKSSWDTLTGGVPYFNGRIGVDGKSRVTVPFFLCSESYDSTVHRVGRSTLGKLWKGFTGFVFGKKGASTSIDHTASTSLRFANAFTPSITTVTLDNIPVGDQLGETITMVVDSTHIKNTVRDSLWMNVWYADTLTDKRPLDTIPHTVYRLRVYPDSTSHNAPTLGTETWRPSPGTLAKPSWTRGAFTPVDTNLRWLRYDISDLDSTTTRSLYPDTLSDRGASGQSAIADIFHMLDTTLPALQFPDTRTQRRISLSQQGKRGRQGTIRSNMIKGALDYLDGVRQPIRVRYQSASITDAQITATSTSHSAQNETGTATAPTPSWMIERLAKAPLLVELGWYTASGRTRGSWALLNGWLNYNGVTRVVIDRDLDEGHATGQARTIGTLVSDNGALCIQELAPTTERCVIESAVSFEYDPTIVFTSVGEDVSREIASVEIVPNPAYDVVTISADLTRSNMAIIGVYTTLGELVLQRVVSSDALMQGIPLSLVSMPTGQFLVRITTTNAVFTQQFVKMQ
jgi:hypothetical protein